MSEIASRVAKVAGIDEALAHKAVEIVLDLVRQHAPADKVKALFERLPDADASDVPETADTGGGLFAGLGGVLGNLGGAAGTMGALNQMTEIGLSMDQVQTVGKEVIAYSREQAGDAVVDDVIASIPGLSQVL